MTTEEIIKDAADKLMGWKLPNDFYPDCYISFDRAKAIAQVSGSWPTGTNLLHHQQAQDMFRHCLGEAIEALVRDADVARQQLSIANLSANLTADEQGFIKHVSPIRNVHTETQQIISDAAKYRHLRDHHAKAILGACFFYRATDNGVVDLDDVVRASIEAEAKTQSPD
jgi:hypothetical protein